MKYFALTVLALTAVVFCQDSLYDESFDPSTLIEPELDWPVVINPLKNDSVLINQIIGQTAVETSREGYRIQVLTTKIASDADSLRKTLNSVVADSIYITYEVPNYKVRVGDYLNRSDAEEVQAQLKKLGYRTAWIVRTRVEVK